MNSRWRWNRIAVAFAVVIFVVFGWLNSMPPARSVISYSPHAGDIKLSLGNPKIVSTYQQRKRFGFMFGYTDGVMGSVPNGKNFLYFGSAKTGPCTSQLAGLTPLTQGVYKLVPAPGNPLRIAQAECRALLKPSGQNPGVNITPCTTPVTGPFAGPYDRDYLGGGPVMRISDGQQEGILIIYHSEFQYGEPREGKANLFFGTLGMAISSDNGKTFQKLGQIIQPHPSRQEWINTHCETVLSVGNGPFILGDKDAQPIDPSNADPETSYIYVFYIDWQSDDCGGQQCLAVARANLAEVMRAAFHHDQKAVPHLFKKYYKGKFAEAAATGRPDNSLPSGLYTHVLKQNFSPSIIYDSMTLQAILATQAGPNGIELRASNRLTQWSEKPLYALNEATSGEGFAVRYPSLVRITGEEGQPQTWLFYSHAPVNQQTWGNTTFMARPVLTAIP